MLQKIVAAIVTLLVIFVVLVAMQPSEFRICTLDDHCCAATGGVRAGK